MLYAWGIHMREIVNLQNGVLPPRRETAHPPTEPAANASMQYVTRFQIVENWTSDPIIQSCYPTSDICRTVEAANKAARALINAEFGRPLEALRWSETFGEDGAVDIRGIYIDIGNNFKVTAWVERQAKPVDV